MLLLNAGDLTQVVPLVDVLRTNHDAHRKQVLAAIAERGDSVPLDDATVWSKVVRTVGELADLLMGRDSEAVVEAARRVLALVEGNALVDPGEFVVDEDIADLRVRFRIMSAAERMSLGGRVTAAATAYRKARADGDEPGAFAALLELQRTQAEYTAASLREVHGLSRLVDDDVVAVAPTDFDFDALDRAGLAADLFVACRFVQGLPAGKAWRCGLPSSPTSTKASSAPDAQAHSAQNSAVTLTAQSSGSMALITPVVVAHDATSSTTLTPPPSSAFGAPAKESRDSPG